MSADIKASCTDKMEKSIANLKRDFSTLRTGRANPQILDRILVDYYGTPTPINQMGNISAPEPRLLVISLWDAKALSLVEKAIQMSDLGINPSNDGKVIRLMIPELTEERRRELCKTAKKHGEESKVAIRAIRRDANEVIKKQRKDGELTEDDQKDLEKQIQELTDDYIKTVDKLTAEKEKDIMAV